MKELLKRDNIGEDMDKRLVSPFDSLDNISNMNCISLTLRDSQMLT